MQLGILSAAAKCYSTRRLVEAAESRGHSVKVINTLAMSLSIEEGEPDLLYKGKEAPLPDAVIPRIGASVTYFGTSVLRQYEQMDVYTPNSSTGIITLDSNKRYWIQATINVIRSAAGNFEFTFQTGAGGSLSESAGVFPMIYIEDSAKPIINSSFVTSLMVSNPLTTYKLRCVTIDANSTFASQSNLFIMEMK